MVFMYIAIQIFSTFFKIAFKSRQKYKQIELVLQAQCILKSRIYVSEYKSRSDYWTLDKSKHLITAPNLAQKRSLFVKNSPTRQ